MPSLLIRDLDKKVLARLKARAESHGRSLQAEIHEILEQAGERSLAETRTLSEQWLARLAGWRQLTDGGELVREDRDQR